MPTNRRSGCEIRLGTMAAIALLWSVALALAPAALSSHAQAVERLQVSNNGRFLVTQSGTPFFWMGDTNWRMYKFTREDIDYYFDDRAAKGFNVIQGPVLVQSHWSDSESLDAYGHGNFDPDNPNLAFFNHIDYIVDAAEQRGMYVALVGAWGNDMGVFGSSQSQRIANAHYFGEWVGNRYRNRSNVIWIVAGEYNLEGNTNAVRQVWDALGDGLEAGSAGNALITIHGSYQSEHQSSSVMFHDASWLSFNMIQSSQSGNWGSGSDNWRLVFGDYQLEPTKPTIDGEAHYEGLGGWTAFGTRRRAYWSVFAGAFGHTYGANAISIAYRGGGDEVPPGNYDPWWVALEYPGSSDMGHVRSLMESRPMLRRIHADSMMIDPSGGVPNRMIATRDQQGRYAMVYVPRKNKTFTVNVSALSGSTIKAWWYDCRNGRTRNAGQFAKAAGGGYRTFTTPNEGQDWVLVLDDVAQGYPRPGVGGPLP